ncbi:hypothetical protein Tco_1341823 [Tanacetum coccineum]
MSTGTPLTQEEAEREALAISIYERYSILEEERLVIETMAYSDKYKKILDEICVDKRKLDGMNKEEEEVIIRIKGETDTPILVGRGFLHTCGGIVNTIENITSTFDGICHQTFRTAKTSLDTAESDNDDEEEYEFQRNKFGASIYGPKHARYLNCSDSLDRSLALQEVMNPFRKICFWKKVVSFLGSLLVALQHVEWKPDYIGCFNKKEDSDGQLWEETMMKPDHQESNALDNTKPWRRMGCGEEIDEMLRIKLYEDGTSVAWIRTFNINEPIYLELCHEFYSTYKFDEVYDDELQTKKIIKFRLGGRAHNLTLLEFARRLGLYHAEELDEEGELRSHASTIRIPVLKVLHKMITYGLCQRITGYDKLQKNNLWLLSMFDARQQNGYVNVAWLIAMWIKRKGADLDTTTLRELIESEGRLIPEDPQLDVPRVAIPRTQRASMQDLYERVGSMEIRQGAIERMAYRQSYHWDMYARVFKHMVGVYSVPLQRAYNPPEYAQP